MDLNLCNEKQRRGSEEPFSNIQNSLFRQSATLMVSSSSLFTFQTKNALDDDIENP